MKRLAVAEKKKKRARGLNNVGKSGSRKRRRRGPASEERGRIFNCVRRIIMVPREREGNREWKAAAAADICLRVCACCCSVALAWCRRLVSGFLYEWVFFKKLLLIALYKRYARRSRDFIPIFCRLPILVLASCAGQQPKEGAPESPIGRALQANKSATTECHRSPRDSFLPVHCTRKSSSSGLCIYLCQGLACVTI